MTNKKPTKKEMFAKILAHTVDKAEREFLEHELELLDKKSSNKSLTPEQKKNEEIKSAILDGLDNNVKMTISGMLKNIPACADLTNQKVSALVRQLRDVGLIVRTEEKGVAYFTKA